MITRVNPLGHISLTNDYFSGLVAASTVREALRNGSLPEKGVTVSQQEGRLVITLHIKVGYGLNIASITQSITHRVKDEVEHATGLKVARIDVFVDDIIDE